jgi:hypothetical protein
VGREPAALLGYAGSSSAMGMFDTYLPSPSLSCPRCGAPLCDLQGKDGPCGLFVWRQGVAAPADQPVDDECKLPVEKRDAFRLPERFEIYTECSECKLWVNATGVCEDGVWAQCVVATNADGTRR